MCTHVICAICFDFIKSCLVFFCFFTVVTRLIAIVLKYEQGSVFVCFNRQNSKSTIDFFCDLRIDDVSNPDYTVSND